MNLKEKAEARRDYLTQQIDDIDKKLRSMPEGTLVCSKNGSHYKWFCRTGSRAGGSNGTRIYIPRSEISQARILAQKAQLSGRREDMSHECASLEHFLHHYPADIHRREKKVLQNPGILELIGEETSIRDDLIIWQNSNYIRLTDHPETLTVSIPGGQMVRSKSEAMIAAALMENGIPFHYEEALVLSGMTIYPDFTIRHPNSGKLYFWEHFGLMDNKNYRNAVFLKLDRFAENGILPGDTLIITFENAEHPMNINYVNTMIDYFFL